MSAPVWSEPASAVSRMRARRARVAFFDIDGTLQPLGKRGIPPSTLRALEILRSRGVKLVICTGRHLDFAREIERYATFDGWLCANGSYCLLDGRVVRAATLDPEDVAQVVAGAAAGRYPLAVTYAHDLEVGVVDAQREMAERFWLGWPKMDPSRLSVGEKPVYQLNIVCPPERDDEYLAATPHLKSARWTDAFMDVIPADGGKDVGMDAVLRELGAARAESLAFGDGGNDISMLEAAGVGIAMGNASDAVRAHADYVTSGCEEEGVLNALVALGIA